MDHQSDDEAALEPELGPLVAPELGLRRHAIRQTSLTVGGRLAQTLLQLIATMILARLLVPSDYGLIAMVAVLIAFVTLIRDVGLTQAMAQSPDLSADQANGLFWTSTAVTGVLVIGTVAVAPLLAWFYGEPELVGVVLVLAVVFFIVGLAVMPQAILARQLSFRRIVSAETTGTVAGVVAAVALAAAGAGYWALVALQAVRSVVTTAMLWASCHWAPGWPRRSAGIGHLLRFGWRVTRFNLLTFISRNTDDVLVGWRWGAGELGQYSAAYRVLLLPLSQINEPLSRVALPTLARLRSDVGRYRMAYLRIAGVALAVTVPAMAVAAVSSDWIIVVMLGPGWELAADVFVWLAIAGLTQPLTNTTGMLLVSQDRSDELAKWGLVSVVLTVPAFLVGLPFGAVGVAAAYAISGLVIRTPLLIYWVGRKGPVAVRDFVSVVRFPFLVAATVAVVAIVVRVVGADLQPIVGLAAIAAAAGMAYAAVLFLTPPGRRLKDEVGSVIRDIRTTPDPDPAVDG